MLISYKLTGGELRKNSTMVSRVFQMFSLGSGSYKACIALIFVAAAFVLVFNIIALVFLLKKHRHHVERRASYKRNELILVSLCLANLLYGLAVFIDFSLFVCDKDVWIGSYVIAFSLIASLVHILTLTTERFVAVKFPFRYKELQPKQIMVILALVWILSIAPAMAVKLNYQMFLQTLFIVLLVSDVTVILVYSYVLYATRVSSNNTTVSHRQPGTNPHDAWSREQREQQAKLTIFCCSIVVTYLASTLPSVIFFWANYGSYMSPFSGKVADALLFLLLLCRSVTDPLIYIFRKRIFSKFSRFFYHTKESRDLIYDDNYTESTYGAGTLLNGTYSLQEVNRI